jgi:hypothetical protein
MAFETKPFLWKRALFGFCCLGLFFLIMNWRGANNYDKFYKASINEKLVRSDSREIRTVKYYTKSDIEIASSVMPPNTFDLKIGDSIVKGKNSGLFKVYRKDSSGEYSFLYTYDYVR